MLLWDFKRIGKQRGMSHCPSGCRSLCIKTHCETHSCLSTPFLNAKEQMLCNFLFRTETIASTPLSHSPTFSSPPLEIPGRQICIGGLPLSPIELCIHKSYCRKIQKGLATMDATAWNANVRTECKCWDCILVSFGLQICLNNELM